MAPNARPWDVRLWLYPGGNPAADPGAWGIEEDISGYVRYPGALGGQAVTYSAGRQDEASRVDFGQMALTLANTDGRFSTANVLGPWWGKLERGCPIRLGVVSGRDSFTRTVASGWGTSETDNPWGTSGTATDWSVTGGVAGVAITAANSGRIAVFGSAQAQDCDIEVTVAAAAGMATGASYGGGPNLRYSDTSNSVRVRLEFNVAGNVTLRVTKIVAGANTQLGVLNPVPASTYTAGQRWKVRAQADGDTIRAKAWPEAGTEPAAWMVTATETQLRGSAVGIYAVRSDLNTNVTFPTVTFDDMIVTAFEFTGSVVEWPVRWDTTGRNSWAPIKAAGILRRLGKAKNGSLQSPLRRQLASYNPTGYWPLEDGASSTSFASVVAGQRPAAFRDARPAADTSLAGGGPAPTITAVGGSISGLTRKPQNGTGFAAMFLSRTPSPPAGPSRYRLARFYTSRGAIVRWDILFNATDIFAEGYDADGTLVVNQSGVVSLDWDQWVAWQLETQVVGGNTNWALTLHQVGSVSYGGLSGSYAGATNSLIYSFSIGGVDVGHLVGASFAHVWLGPNTLPFVTNSFSLVSSGYAGELASDRIRRVGAEAGIPVTIEPGTSEPLGPQRGARALDVIRAAEEADLGILYERGNGLGYRPRSARYNQTVLMALSVAAGQIAEPPEPADDDQRVKNSITVSRDGGSSYTYRDEAHIARQGEYQDSATLNVETDEVLPHQAAWRGHLGTKAALRWPGISLDFARNPGLLPAWRSKQHGFRMTVTTGRLQVTGNDPDVIAEGYTAELTPRAWTVRLACSLARPWTAGVVDDTGILGRADTAGCQTTAVLSTTGTSIPITTTLGPAWDTAAGIFPMDVNVGGERITIASITGTGPAQTANVAIGGRSKNGVVKAHPIGTAVSLWDPAIAAL